VCVCVCVPHLHSHLCSRQASDAWLKLPETETELDGRFRFSCRTPDSPGVCSVLWILSSVCCLSWPHKWVKKGERLGAVCRLSRRR